jgi:hypothetical protein
MVFDMKAGRVKTKGDFAAETIGCHCAIDCTVSTDLGNA